MKILIIDDSEYKYNDIKEALNRVLIETPSITWEKSRNSGLLSIRRHNYRENEFEPYDVVICDNYMPIYDEDMEIRPYGEYIVREIRKRFKLNDLTIIMCSSEYVENCDYNYQIKYDSSVMLDGMLEKIFKDMEECHLKEKNDKNPVLVKKYRDEK